MTRVAIRDVRHASFFQLVKLLLRGRPGAARPGDTGPPVEEPLRFRPAVSLAFAPCDVDEVDTLPARGGTIPARTRVTVNFMGLYGPA